MLEYIIMYREELLLRTGIQYWGKVKRLYFKKTEKNPFWREY
jgi:hypothetical protein